MNLPYLPNSWGRIGRIWHVAMQHPDANDDNPGTINEPLHSISAAAQQAKEFDTILIDEGIYREEVALIRHGHHYRPESRILFQAVEDKQVYLRGSDIFKGNWENLGNNTWSASLPDALFEADAYNPYALYLASDVQKIVRPMEGDQLPETRGQIYMDGQPCAQVCNVEQLHATPLSFLVDQSGRHILVNFGYNNNPNEHTIELTMRKRCIRPDFEGAVIIETRGIVVEHAAEPGPFCKCSPLSLRCNLASDTAVYKTWNLPNSSLHVPTLMSGAPGYQSINNSVILASLVDATKPQRFDEMEMVSASSKDAGRTWQLEESTRRPYAQAQNYSYTLDERTGMLMRHYIEHRNGLDPEGFFGTREHAVMLQISSDGGNSWSAPQLINEGKRYYFNILPLDNGTLFWPFMEGSEDNRHHARVGTVIGKWSEDHQHIDWEQTGWIEVAPGESIAGLSEPSVAQFANGCLFMVLRMGAVLPAQNRSGQPSIKLFSISDDNGHSWSKPQPLTYDDDKYIYSPRSFQQTFRSIKNGRVYVLMNISERPTTGCDPRTALHMIEIDEQTLRARRDTLTVIEEKHPEHHELIRYSNWQTFQDRQTGNLILFMGLHMSEFCPIRFGYDTNLYRYEVVLPSEVD